MKKLGLYLESAFRSMKIFYQKIENPRQLIYKIVFPESGILCGTVTLVVDEMFSAEISAFIARGVAEDRRISVLEEINRVNDKCCFINVGMDDKNDVYSYQQFILMRQEDSDLYRSGMNCRQPVRAAKILTIQKSDDKM